MTFRKRFAPALLAFGSVLAILSCQMTDDKQWDNPADSDGVNYHHPALRVSCDSLFVDSSQVEIRVVATSQNSTVARIQWSVDGLKQPSAAFKASDSVVDVHVPGLSEAPHAVALRVQDETGLWSDWGDTVRFRIWNEPPKLAKVRDTSLVWSGKLDVKLPANDADGGVAKTYWSLSKDRWTDSSGKVALEPKAEGVKTVYWAARDNFGKAVLDSFVATFTNKAPKLAEMRDTVLSTRRIFSVALLAKDSDGTISRYLFDSSGGRWDSTLSAPTLTIASAMERTKTIVWGVRDDLGTTVLDTFVVQFTEKPVLTPVRDTALSSTKTLSIALMARDVDPSESIVKYLWSTSESGWTDSSSDGKLSLSRRSGDVAAVRWVARNDQGKLSLEDTFTVSFVPPPVIASLQMDSVLQDWTGSTGTVVASWIGSVPGFANEEVTWTLRFGVAGSVAQGCQGGGTSWSKTGIDSGKTFQYELVAENRFGESARQAGHILTKYVPQPKTSYGIPWNDTVTYGYFIDKRDGQLYFTVEVGGKTWMAQNLNYAGESNTVGICYNASNDSCSKYGRLYTWSEVMAGASSSRSSPSGVQGICPDGWHVPSAAELSVVGGGSTAATMLKSSKGWLFSNGVDAYGFRVLPAGRSFIYERRSTTEAGKQAYFWSASGDDDSYGAQCLIFYPSAAMIQINTDGKAASFSLRCSRD